MSHEFICILSLPPSLSLSHSLSLSLSLSLSFSLSLSLSLCLSLAQSQIGNIVILHKWIELAATGQFPCNLQLYFGTMDSQNKSGSPLPIFFCSDVDVDVFRRAFSITSNLVNPYTYCTSRLELIL
jgi:hypothetical protein